MRPIKTTKYDGIYGAPRGYENEIGGLPYYRERNDFGGNTIYSVWTFDDGEREAIAKGYNIVLGIVGEPIPPVSIGITHLNEQEEKLTEEPISKKSAEETSKVI